MLYSSMDLAWLILIDFPKNVGLESGKKNHELDNWPKVDGLETTNQKGVFVKMLCKNGEQMRSGNKA